MIVEDVMMQNWFPEYCKEEERMHGPVTDWRAHLELCLCETFLMSAFVWGETEKGFVWWENIYDEFREIW